jgi:hypothetical protein
MISQTLAPGRVAQTAKKITGFEQLQPGWHYGGATPPTQHSIDLALSLNVAIWYAGFRRTNAFPGVDGEVRVTGYHGTIYLECTVELNGHITLVLEQDDREVMYREGLSMNEAFAELSKLRGITWASSGSSIRATTTPTEDVSQASHSDIPLTEVASQPLKKSVAYGSVEASANILLGSTTPYRALRLYSGS